MGAKRGGARWTGGVRGWIASGLVAAVLAGCAPSLQHSHVDLQTLTRSDFEANHFHTAYEAVEALRGNWLLARTNSAVTPFANEVQVYMDNVRLGTTSELQTIAIQSVAYIRHYDANEATARWGLGHTQGVIFVSTHPNTDW